MLTLERSPAYWWAFCLFAAILPTIRILLDISRFLGIALPVDATVLCQNDRFRSDDRPGVAEMSNSMVVCFNISNSHFGSFNSNLRLLSEQDTFLKP